MGTLWYHWTSDEQRRDAAEKLTLESLADEEEPGPLEFVWNPSGVAVPGEAHYAGAGFLSGLGVRQVHLPAAALCNLPWRGIQRSIRNLRVLIARGRAERQPGKAMRITVKHDDWCPGLKRRSMLFCECRPVLEFSEL